jgi:lysophospholipase L1-like esterase
MLRKIGKFFLKAITIFLITVIIFLTLDFFFGSYVRDKYIASIKDNPIYHKKQRIRHGVYHHTLAPNIDYKKTGWGPKTYRLCTDEWGLKYKCNTRSKKTYTLAIFGDSFVEGLGVPYEETFVGIINKKTIPEIANMGVSSYSPKIYYSKLKYFIDSGFKFNHIIFYIDVSDLIDDMNSYVLLPDKKVRDKQWNKRIEWYINAKFPMLDQLIFRFTKSNRYRVGESLLKPIEIYTDPSKIIDQDIAEIYSKMNLRSVWTYAKEDKIKGYDYSIARGIEEQLETMDDIFDYLDKLKIKASIAVYPWPQTILNDVTYNKHVKIWEEFCKIRCRNFINHYPLFMNDKNSIDTKKKIIKKYYQLGDIHFNSEGHKVIAEDFLKKFKF